MGSPAVNLAEYLWPQPQGWNPAYPVLSKVTSAFFFNDGLRSYKNLPWLSQGYSANLGNAGMTMGTARTGRFIKKNVTAFAYLFSGTISPGYASSAMLVVNTGGGYDLYGDGSKVWRCSASGFLDAYFSSGVRGTGSTSISTGLPVVVSSDDIAAATKGYVNGVQEISFSGWGSVAGVSRIGDNGAGNSNAGHGVQVFLGFSSVLTAAEHKQIADILLRDPMELFAPPQPVIWSGAASSGGSFALSGGATSSVSATGALSVAIPVVGAAVSTVSAGGIMSVAKPLAGASSIISLANGTLSVAVNISGAAVSTAFSSGNFKANFALSGAAVMTALAVGGLTASGSGALAGSALMQVSATGAISTSVPLVGQASAVATATGGTKTSVPLTGAAISVSSATGNLQVGITGISGAAVANAVGSGTLSIQVRMGAAAVMHALATGAMTSTGSGGCPTVDEIVAGVVAALVVPRPSKLLA